MGYTMGHTRAKRSSALSDDAREVFLFVPMAAVDDD